MDVDAASCKESPGSSTGASFHSTGERKAARQPAMLCSSCLESRAADPLTHILLHAPLPCLGQGMPSDLQVGVLGCQCWLALQTAVTGGYIHAVLIPGATPDTCRSVPELLDYVRSLHLKI